MSLGTNTLFEGRLAGVVVAAAGVVFAAGVVASLLQHEGPVDGTMGSHVCLKIAMKED